MTIDLEPWAKDAIYVHTDIHFDWRDRLRILFGWPVHVRSMTLCEEKPGRVQSVADVNIERIFRIRRKPICFVAEEKPEPKPANDLSTRTGACE